MSSEPTTKPTAYQFDMTTEGGRRAAWEAGEYRGQQDCLRELDNPASGYQMAYDNGWRTAGQFEEACRFFGRNFTNDTDAFRDRYAESYAGEYMSELARQLGVSLPHVGEAVHVFSSGLGTLLPYGWHTGDVTRIDALVPLVQVTVDHVYVVTVRGAEDVRRLVRREEAERSS